MLEASIKFKEKELVQSMELQRSSEETITSTSTSTSSTYLDYSQALQYSKDLFRFITVYCIKIRGTKNEVKHFFHIKQNEKKGSVVS